MKRLFLPVTLVLSHSSSPIFGADTANRAILGGAGKAASKTLASIELRNAKDAVAKKDVDKALSELKNAEKHLSEPAPAGANGQQGVFTAKAKASQARKELEAARTDKKPEHFTKASALLDEAMGKL